MSHPVFAAKEQECGCVVYAFNYMIPCPNHDDCGSAVAQRGYRYGRLFSRFTAHHDRMPIGWENAALLAAADGTLEYEPFRTTRELRS